MRPGASRSTRRRGYDRSRLLADAAAARRRGRSRKAIALYRQVLDVEPDNTELRRRVAKLLADTRQHQESLAAYRRVLEELVRQDLVERAIGVCRDALRQLPRRVELWVGLADLELRLRQPADAIGVLLEGRKHFRGRRLRGQALRLLGRAHRIDPTHFEANFELARLLAVTGERRQAIRLLKNLAGHTRARQLRRVRARLFRLSPTPATAWRWLRAMTSA